jgi:hypothetical protein
MFILIIIRENKMFSILNENHERKLKKVDEKIIKDFGSKLV